jgi:hypothetical protein
MEGFAHGLGDQHAIDGIAVVEWKSGDESGMTRRNG